MSSTVRFSLELKNIIRITINNLIKEGAIINPTNRLKPLPIPKARV